MDCVCQCVCVCVCAFGDAEVREIVSLFGKIVIEMHVSTTYTKYKIIFFSLQVKGSERHEEKKGGGLPDPNYLSTLQRQVVSRTLRKVTRYRGPHLIKL